MISVEVVVLVGIVLLAFIAALGIVAWREVRLEQARRPTGLKALFGASAAKDEPEPEGIQTFGRRAA